MTTTEVDPLTWLADLLDDGPVPADQVRAAAGVELIPTHELRRAARDLGVQYIHTDDGVLMQIQQPVHRRSAGSR